MYQRNLLLYEHHTCDSTRNGSRDKMQIHLEYSGTIIDSQHIRVSELEFIRPQIGIPRCKGQGHHTQGLNFRTSSKGYRETSPRDIPEGYGHIKGYDHIKGYGHIKDCGHIRDYGYIKGYGRNNAAQRHPASAIN